MNKTIPNGNECADKARLYLTLVIVRKSVFQRYMAANTAHHQIDVELSYQRFNVNYIKQDILSYLPITNMRYFIIYYPNTAQ